jgi:negative regulator of flagellin synthesis FlgM
MGNLPGYSRPLEGLKPLLGLPPTAPAATQQPKSGAATSADAVGSAHTAATLSGAKGEVSPMDAEAGARMDKVASVQAALAAGTYHVPASVVAFRVVDAMLVP